MMSNIPDGPAGPRTPAGFARPTLSLLIQNGEVCRSLRSKTMFYQVEDPGDPPEGPFWCVKTQSPLGPDGQVAEVDVCRPGRGCCETT